jgi:hypothetical protein
LSESLCVHEMLSVKDKPNGTGYTVHVNATRPHTVLLERGPTTIGCLLAVRAPIKVDLSF